MDKKNHLSKLKKILILIFLLFPIFSSFIFILSHGVNVVDFDQVDILFLAKNIHDDKASIKDFYAFHNEHRILFPRIFMISLGQITKYNDLVLMYITLLLLIGVALLVWLKILSQFKLKRIDIRGWFIPISLLIFNFRQLENLMNGFQIVFSMCLSTSIFSLYLLDTINKDKGSTKNNLLIGSAIIFGIITSFSWFGGLFVWIAGCIILLCKEKYSLKLFHQLGWFISGVLIWLIYIDFSYLNIIRFHSINEALNGFIFFTSLIGNSLFAVKGSTLIAGILILALSFYISYTLYKDKKIKENAFWLSLLIFSYLITIAITLGRYQFGLSASHNSRNAMFTVFIVLSLFVILKYLTTVKKNNVKTIILTILFIMIILSSIFSFKLALNDLNYYKNFKEEHKIILLNYRNSTDEDLIKLYSPSADKLRGVAAFMEEEKLNVFCCNNSTK